MFFPKKPMPFECKKYHCKCAAECCGVVPIPIKIWHKNQHNIQRTVIEQHRLVGRNLKNPILKEKCILPITSDNYCPFLKQDLSCAIYEERPELCRKFGDESHKLLCCPMQDKDGNPR